MDELYKYIEPVFIAEYEATGKNSGMNISNFLDLRRTEMKANELRFPGTCEFYVKKIKKVKRLQKWGGILLAGILAICIKI
jgi:hypothetical protein